MSDKPEYVRCIQKAKGISLCGEYQGFMFIDIAHVLYNAAAEGRLVPCSECIEVWESENKKGLANESTSP